MKQSTRFIIGSVAFILLFSVVAFKLQDDSLLLNATTLHEKLVRTTNDFKGLSLVNHLLLRRIRVFNGCTQHLVVLVC